MAAPRPTAKRRLGAVLALVALLLSTVGIVVAAPASADTVDGPTVGLFASDYPQTITGVRDQLVATGAFASVTALPEAGCTAATPSLANLQKYDEVLFWTNCQLPNARAVGDALADYVDGGGHLVVAVFAMAPGYSVDGRIVTGGYLPVTLGNGSSYTASGFIADLPDDPLLAGVTSDAGSGDLRAFGITLTDGSTQVAHWTDGQPFAAYRDDVTMLNVYPAFTSYTRLLQNALHGHAAPTTQAPAITSTANAAFQAGAAGSFTVQSTGSPTATLTETGTLPSGVTFVDNGDGTATLAGTPTVTGVFRLTLSASNGVDPDASQAFTLTVHQAPSISSADSATFAVGSAGTFSVTTTAGYPSATMLTETGTLPTGVTFVDNGDGTATLAGTPDAGTGGDYVITIDATNGVDPDVYQQFTLTVTDVPTIGSVDSAGFTVGTSGSFSVTTTAGFPATTTLTETGTLPTGVTFVDNGDGTATLAGTPDSGSAGSYPLTLTATNDAGSSTQSFTVTVALDTQAVTITSTAPSPAAVVGQTYAVTTTGGMQGTPVEVGIDEDSSGVCTISGTTVTFTHPGSCVIDADRPADGRYAAASTSQTVAVSKAATTTALMVHPTSLSAVVTPVAPGAGGPTGTVTFSVDGTSVGTASLLDGTATLPYQVASGKSRSVAADYAGDVDFTGSNDSTARKDPKITATVSSAKARTSYGWYRTPVTVTFRCTTNGAALTKPCPAPVTLTRSRAGQSVTRAIHATDGGAAMVTVRGLNIDRTDPRVAVTGVKAGATYPGQAPTARCASSDALSGIARCTITRTVSGESVRVTATATDRAGNVSSTSVRLSVARFYIAGVAYRNGAYQVREGRTYVVVALTSGTARPRYYSAAPHGQRPSPRGSLFTRSGTQSGLHRFVLEVRIDRGLGRYPLWDMGVKSGSTLHRITFHPAR